MRTLLNIAVKAALEAGKVIMEIYLNENLQVEIKDDLSPLTLADQKANEVINSILGKTGIPIISEENKQVSYKERKDWKQCWIVDPLDGTKEFIKRNGEFTVNISHVIEGKPVLGVIYAPALDILYFAVVGEKKAYKLEKASISLLNLFENSIEIKPVPWEERIIVAGSRSHMNEKTLSFINGLKNENNCEIEVVSKGSSLKFCLMAAGESHFYPRFAPTMEWDTAAGQAICEAVGLKCGTRESGEPLTYNKENLLNPHFLVSHERKL